MAVEHPPNVATIIGSLLTVSVTAIVCGLFAAPPPFTEIVELYVPTFKIGRAHV